MDIYKNDSVITNQKVTPVNKNTDDYFLDMQKDEEEFFNKFTFYKIDYFLLALFLLLFSIVFLQFFTRYVLNDSLSWTEEAARYVLILVAFSGAIRCQMTGSHIILEFLDDKFGDKILPYVKVLANVIGMIAIGIITYSAYQLSVRTSFQKMVSLGLPKYYLYYAIIFFLVINFIVLLYSSLKQIKDIRTGKHI